MRSDIFRSGSLRVLVTTVVGCGIAGAAHGWSDGPPIVGGGAVGGGAVVGDDERTISAERVAFIHQPTLAGLAIAGMDLADESIPASNSGAVPFGRAGALRLNLLGGYANDFNDAHQGGGGVAVSYFLAERFSIDIETLGWGFSQRGSNAAGFNANLIFRWHFYERGPWTLYGDGGAGVLLSTKDVPSDGTSFNFTPQLGLGMSYEVVDDVHLLLGVRWFHISNARLSTDNPGRDSLLIYAGFSLPLR